MFQKYEIGYNRYATVTTYKDRKYLHIREHDVLLGFPTSIGVSLNPSRFAILCMIADEVTEKLKNVLNSDKEFEYKTHLGGGIYCVIRSGCWAVNLRRYFIAKDKMYPIPTKKGISLRPIEWNRLKAHLVDIKEKHPELNNAMPCGFSDSHNNQESAFACIECYPFGTSGLYP